MLWFLYPKCGINNSVIGHMESSETYWWCPLCSACVVHPALRWGTRGRLAARSLRGDVHESTPGAAAGRECGANGGPSRTESREERWERWLAFFSKCFWVYYILWPLNFIAIFLIAIYDSWLKHNTNVLSVTVIITLNSSLLQPLLDMNEFHHVT